MNGNFNIENDILENNIDVIFINLPNDSGDTL